MLRALGGVRLTRSDGVEVRSVLAQPKRLAVLTYLALASPGEYQRRDHLLAVFWPESDEERARGALRTTLHFLRSSLGQEAVETRGNELRIPPGALWCDAVGFEESVRTGQLEKALALYRGPLLPGLNVDGAPDWDEWLDRERTRMARLATEAAWTLAEGAETGGDAAEAARWAHQTLAFAPEEEEPLRRVMTLLDRLGERAAALHAYEEFSRRIRDAYDAEPSPQTRLVGEALRYNEQAATLPPVLLQPDSAPEPVPQTSPDSPTPPSTRPGSTWWVRRRGPLAAAVLGIVLLLLLHERWPIGGGRPSGPALQAERVAVLPFSVRGYTRYDYLGPGMVDLLSVKLDGAGQIRAADPRTLLGMVEPPRDGAITHERAREVARGLGAGMYILGSVVASERRLQLSAALYESGRGQAEPVAQASVEGDARDLFAIVDALVAQLLADQLRGPKARLDRLAARTTTSLPALKAYLRGEEALRAGQVDQAVEAFQQAVAWDSAFALAWYRLSVATALAGERTGSAAEQAVRYAAQLAPHDRLLLRAWHASWAFRYAEAERLYREAVAERPDDVEAWEQLGKVLFHGGPPRGRPATEARFAFERVLALHPNNATALTYLARLAVRKGPQARAEQLIKRALAAYPADPPALLLGLCGVALADDAALRETTDALRLSSDARAWHTAWRVLEDTQMPLRSRPLFLPLTDPARAPRVRARGYVALAHMALARGQWSRARPHLAAAARLDSTVALQARALFSALPFLPVPRDEVERVRDAILHRSSGAPDVPAGPYSGGSYYERPFPELRLHHLGVLEARLGNADQALDYAERIEQLTLPPDARVPTRNLADGVRAHVAWINGPAAQGLAAMDSAWQEVDRKPEVYPYLFSPAHPRFLRAELLRLAGHDEQALAWYASVLEDIDYGIVYAAPVHLRQAQILDRLGRPAEAAEHYRRFAELWRDADPALRPIVARAERRRIEIQAQR